MIAGIVVLLCLFAGCVVLTLGRSGLRMLAALALTGLFIGVLGPALVRAGVSPLLVVLPGAAIVAVVGLPIIGGFNRKSLAAALGTCAALLIAGLLPLFLSAPLQLTGLDTCVAPRADFEVHLWYSPALAKVNFRQLLVAAVILASLGAVMDVAMTIASSVQQVSAADGTASFRRKFGVGYRVGTKVLGPMLTVMLLVFLGADLAVNVARARVPGNFWDLVRLMNYESIAAHVLETLTAGLGLFSCIPLTALFAAWLGRPAHAAIDAGKASPVERPAHRRRGTVNTVVRILGALAVILTAFAIDRGFIASYERAPVIVDQHQATRTQDALARVLRIEPAVEVPPDAENIFNPARERTPERHHPCAALVLTGEHRGRVAAFRNRIQDRPYLNLLLRPGSLVLLSVTASGREIVAATAYVPPMRWRSLVWGAALLFAFIIMVLGTGGGRAVGLVLAAGGTVLLVTIPLLAGGCSVVLVMLVSFLLVAAFMLALWGHGWKAALCAVGGTGTGLIAGGIIAFAAGHLMGLTGECYAHIRMLKRSPMFSGLDFGQLLSLGITIIAMGAALDVAASVLSGQIEFRRSRPEAAAAEVRKAGFAVNRDVAATMVLTLCFAWLALRLPVMLATPALEEGGPQKAQWVGWYAAETAQLVSACVAVMLAGPLSAVLFSFVCREPSGRRTVGKLNIASLVALVFLTLLSLMWFNHTQAPSAKAKLDLAAIEQATSLDELEGWATERKAEKDWDGLMVIYWRELELNPKDFVTYSDLAYLYMVRGWTELARDLIDRALPHLPNHAEAHYVAGILAWREGDQDTAVKELEKAVELDPDYKAAKDALRRTG